ncbi:butyryl-CoA dehydrogenase [Actinomycetota bacterium]|nr:butyryl-CoA dehydrogenase [Actinomycetota bacterium]
MNFELTEEQALIQEAAKEFSDKYVAPRIFEIDETNSIPQELVDQIIELGFVGIPHPAEYGGAGSDYLSYILVLEQIARNCTGICGVITTNNLAVNAIKMFGTEEQKQKYLPDLCTGKKSSTFVFTEPSTGSDHNQIETTAVLDGDYWILNGVKRFATGAEKEGPITLFARDDQSNGITAFTLDKFCEGYSISEPWAKSGYKGNKTYDVFLDDVRIPKENMLGELGKGFMILQQNVGFGKISISAVALGRAQGALEASIEYAKTRIQRGKPITSFPTLRFRLANMAAKVEACRWMVYRLGFLASQAKTPELRAALAIESAKTKLFVTENSYDVVRDAVQVHGSYGVTKEFKVEIMLRDCAVAELIEGVKDVQAMLVGGAITH